MKVVLLAGGLGTRLSEETVVKPKPMVEIGGHVYYDKRSIDCLVRKIRALKQLKLKSF
jgi:choline kinase